MPIRRDVPPASSILQAALSLVRSGGVAVVLLSVGVLTACMTEANDEAPKGDKGGPQDISQSQADPQGKPQNVKDLFRSLTARQAEEPPAKRYISPQAAFLAGQHAMATNDYAKAADYFAIALRFRPDAEPLIRRTFFLFAATGDFAQAGPLGDKLLQIDPNMTLPRVARVVDAYRRGKFDAAKLHIDALKGPGVNGLLGALFAAWWHMREGARDIDAALAALEPLKADAAFASLYHFHTALIADIAGRAGLAREHFTALLGMDGAMSIHNVDAAASFFLRAGDKASADKAYALYETQHPGSQLMADHRAAQEAAAGRKPLIADSAAGMAQTTLTAAFSLQQNNDTSSALILTQATLAFQPDYDLARVLLGDIYHDIGRLKDAGAAYEAVPKDSPTHYTAALRLGDNLNRRGRIKDAVALLRDVAAAYPDRSEALVTLGDILRQEKRYEEAFKAYDDALKRIPQVETRHWEIIFNRGISLERAKRWQEAEKDLLKALEMQPDQPYVLNYLGYTWLDMGLNVDKAKAMIEKAVDQRPRDGYITDSLGWAHYLTGDYPKATQVLQRAVELAPDDPTITDHYGDALWRADRRLEARFQWERVLTLKPEPDLEKTVRDKLEGRAGPAGKP